MSTKQLILIIVLYLCGVYPVYNFYTWLESKTKTYKDCGVIKVKKDPYDITTHKYRGSLSIHRYFYIQRADRTYFEYEPDVNTFMSYNEGDDLCVNKVIHEHLGFFTLVFGIIYSFIYLVSILFLIIISFIYVWELLS